MAWFRRFSGSCSVLLCCTAAAWGPLAAQPELPGCVWTQFTFATGGLASQGCLVDGKPEGIWETYHANGALKSKGGRENHLLEGLWSFYDEQGVLQRTVEYREDQRTGWEVVFGTEGQTLERVPFVANRKQGEATYHHRSGAVQKRIPFDQDEEHGLGLEYAEDGRLIARLDYYRGHLRGIERINRYDELGLRTGMWVLFHPQGGVQEEGPYLRDQRHGVFKFYDAKGDLMRLERYAYGEPIAPDETTLLLDVRTSYLPDGGTVVGSYHAGEAHGVFRNYDATGALVGGSVYHRGRRTAEGITGSDGLREGHWRFFDTEDRCVAEGKYEGGLRQGEWKYYDETGFCIQVGTYRDDLYHGEWVWFYAEGAVHRREHYRKGLEDGSFEEWDRDGRVLLKGEYLEGLRQGHWSYHVNDHREEGAYVDGEKDGPWVHFYENGQIRFEGNYVQGVPDGRHRYWRIDGNRSVEENYVAGVPDGTWVYSGDDPSMQHTRTYNNGTLVRVDGNRVGEGSPDEPQESEE